MTDWNDAKANPYAPPQSAAPPIPWTAPVTDDLPLAGVSTRFLGNLVDMILFVPTAVPGLILLVLAGDDDSPVPFAVMGVCATLFAAFQWYLVATTGQSLAKRWFGMRIVKIDGSPVNFVSGVLLRTWVMFALRVIPIAGNFLGLADALMIFSQDRRCLHDRLAGTKVVTLRG
jgi:uncharacterized RDD family membrane protein YckC